MSVFGIEGGLTEPRFYSDDAANVPSAPIRVDFDYTIADRPVIVVAEVATDLVLTADVHVGDTIETVNGIPLAERIEAARPYFRYSTELGFRKKFAESLPFRTGILPPSFYTDQLELVVRHSDGELVNVSLTYTKLSDLTWQSDLVPRYPGFDRMADREFARHAGTNDRIDGHDKKLQHGRLAYWLRLCEFRDHFQNGRCTAACLDLRQFDSAIRWHRRSVRGRHRSIEAALVGLGKALYVGCK